MLPKINDCMYNLGGGISMSALDLMTGYWNLEVRPKDRYKLAFISRYGLFQFV